MHFKYLEPECQIIEHGNLKNFLNSDSPFIGIYINCNKGDFRKSEFVELLGNSEVRSIVANKILMHYFVMDTCECVIKTIVDQFTDLLTTEKEIEIFDAVLSTFPVNNYSEKKLVELKKVFNGEKKKIDRAIDNYFINSGVPGNRFHADDINFVDTSLNDGSFLHTLLNSLRRELFGNTSIPFYFLYDEANELLEFQKRIINTFISQRKHSLISIKVSCQPRMYNIFFDINNRFIQETHDYYLIELDSLYTTDKTAYHDRIKQIAERRLEIFGASQNNIAELLPENPGDRKKIDEAIKYTIEEYCQLPEKEKLAKQSEYIKKYAMARFFQKFTQKSSYGYTGFSNLVHFSSGIIRSFLEPCYSMLEEFKLRNPAIDMKDIKEISYEIQRNVIEDYSNLYIQKDIIDPLHIEPEGSRARKVLEGLRNLIDSLGSVFALRLKDEKSREPRIISFSIREPVTDDLIKEILDHAVQKAFLHQKWYRAKSGHEMHECYILNRRLCPRFHLDLSSFQGRFELSQQELLLATTKPKDFVKKFEKESTKFEQIQLFDF
jgi:hypothetical protein